MHFSQIFLRKFVLIWVNFPQRGLIAQKTFNHQNRKNFGRKLTARDCQRLGEQELLFRTNLKAIMSS
jgi:hypothetical protein